MIKLRDEEIQRLEGEITGYRDDIDNMFESFQQREQELRQEMAIVENRNQARILNRSQHDKIQAEHLL